MCGRPQNILMLCAVELAKPVECCQLGEMGVLSR